MAQWIRNSGAEHGDWYSPAYIMPGYRRDPNEYPGFYNNLVLAPGHYPVYGMPYQQSQAGKSEQEEASDKSEKSEASFKLTKAAHNGRSAALAWPTERPTRLRVPICCDDCRTRLRTRLENLPGVHDVGIEGWSSALVTVTGTAKLRDILQETRSVSPTSSVWDKSDSMDEFSAKASYLKHH